MNNQMEERFKEVLAQLKEAQKLIRRLQHLLEEYERQQEKDS